MPNPNEGPDQPLTPEQRAIFDLMAPRSCTCHPDDNPPSPCPRKYALAECRRASLSGRDGNAR